MLTEDFIRKTSPGARGNYDIFGSLLTAFARSQLGLAAINVARYTSDRMFCLEGGCLTSRLGLAMSVYD